MTPAINMKACFEEKVIHNSSDLENKLSSLSRPLVFTNGCFDILHRGHVTYLQQAAQLGNTLLVAVNDDDSVRKLAKGDDRPINILEDRMAILAALDSVDIVIAFSEPTPISLIEKTRPDHLVKGGDWPTESIVGSELVSSYGGQVLSIPHKYSRSTTALIKKIKRNDKVQL